PTGPTGLQGPTGPTGICECDVLECTCTEQIRNVLLQIAGATGTVNVNINTENGGNVTGQLTNVSQVGEGIVVLDDGTIISICKIAWIRTPNTNFETLGITPLILPEPGDVSCEDDCEEEIRNALIVGTTYNISAGGNATGNRRINSKAVGIVFVGQQTGQNITTDTAISTCDIEFADPQ
ncbi:hypothetical protein V7654_23615, partial [Bacillus sp. JJ1609]|uniref:hypothetical protein n=1 Tax=Bacillus sp. JJ1609 TaxID=3122977 RepID=UPI002FFDB24C